MRFVSLDVETANANMASICQIGSVVFDGGRIVEEWCTLLDPEDDFDSVNIAVHGITPEAVEGAPIFPEIVDRLREVLACDVSVCHTHFDRVSLAQDCARYGLAPIDATWLDSARVARRTWADCAWRGYGLKNLCARIGYEFRHHDALEDARAAGYVLLAAVGESQKDLAYWLRRVTQPIDLTRSSSRIEREGNREGDLFGEVLVFTGSLTLPRNEAADLAASVGCRIAPGVTRETTILVVGDQDVRKLAPGMEKSSKHRKAEQLVRKGQLLRIVCETDFRALVHAATFDV
jgi:DNA polymerase III subunit epsilon